jgi:NAD(P)-dependent dehydrogenase (short-subunit alcohol dehydrogenase family)
MDGSLKSLSGKTCLVTGATSGIGLATVLALTRLGGRVVGVGRDEAKIAAALSLASREAPADSSGLRFERADLASLRDVEALAGRLTGATDRLDVLVNCAGIYTARRDLTADGLETQFAVNHLAPFLLTTLLLPRLESSGDARVITVSSNSHYYAVSAGRIPS